MIRLVVVGTPVTQGSKSAFYNKALGRSIIKEQNDVKHKSWREAVASAARQWVIDNDIPEQITGPVVVKATFALQRPKSAPKRTRTWPIKARSGDLDKLLRSVLDSLTGPLLADDSQVVVAIAMKDWGDPPGVVVEIIPVGVDLGADWTDWMPAALPQDVTTEVA